MGAELVPSDVSILDLLRRRSLSVGELGKLLGVTGTAVRQRLNRLMAQGYVDREIERAARGRPSHRYALTEAGRRKTGANFGDLAIALWEEIRAIQDPEVRRGLLQRLAKRLAERYAGAMPKGTVADRMEAIATLFQARQLPFVVEGSREAGGLPVLSTTACPYPGLAEQDRAVCALERLVFTELLGETVRLSHCRLDGADCCTFAVHEEPVGKPRDGVGTGSYGEVFG